MYISFPLATKDRTASSIDRNPRDSVIIAALRRLCLSVDVLAFRLPVYFFYSSFDSTQQKTAYFFSLAIT
jgi:hypothetical protein